MMNDLMLLILKHHLKIKGLEPSEKSGPLSLKLSLLGPSGELVSLIGDLEMGKKYIHFDRFHLSTDPDSGNPSQAILETELQVDPALERDPVLATMMGPDTSSPPVSLLFMSADKPVMPPPPPPEMIKRIAAAHRKIPRRPPPESMGNQASGLQFLGTVMSGGMIEAVIDVKGDVKLLRRGDSVGEGSRVIDIQPGRVVLSGPMGEQLLTLEEKTAPPAPDSRRSRGPSPEQTPPSYNRDSDE